MRTSTGSESAEAIAQAIVQEVQDDLPSRAAIAIQVLLLTDDPDVGIGEIAQYVMRDAGLTARVLRTANSAYYGLPGRATSTQFAVSVIGCDTLRALAAGVAVGLDDDPTKLPEGFLDTAAHVSVASAAVAPRVGVPAAEAQGLGLLHNLGCWLLHRHDPDGYRALRRRAQQDKRPLHRLEQQRYGVRNGELAAALLESWGFPHTFTEAIALQHEPAEQPRARLAMVLAGGIALASASRDERLREPTPDETMLLAACHALPDLRELTAQVRSGAREFAAALR